jgi:phage gp29-like protein
VPRHSKSLAKARMPLPATNGNGIGSSSRTLVASTDYNSQLVRIMNNDRMLFELSDLSPREMTGILRQAKIGNLVYQERLFQLMIDQWSRLGKNILTLKRDVSNLNWTVNAFAEKDEAATSSAQEKAQLVERALFGMTADPKEKLRDFHGLLKDLVSAVPMCFSISEIYWTERDGEVVPQCTKKIPARYFGYSLELDKPDKLMLNQLGNLSFQSSALSDFPENKFLIGIFEANDNHPTTAAMLRGLVPWFMGQKFGLKWFFIYAQMFGIPTRIAKYNPGDETVKQELISMLERMAEANYGVFPTDASLELIESKVAGTLMPQRELIRDANDECDIAILGQTLTSTSGHAGGNRALGEVHADTRDDVLNGTADFVAGVINTQLIPAILMLNFGEASEAPTLEGKTEEAKDELAMVQRDAVLFGSSVGQLQLPVSKDWFYARHSVPEPAADAELYTPPGVGRDELFGPEPEPPPTIVMPPGGPHLPGDTNIPTDDKTPPGKPTKPAKASASEPLVPSIQMANAVKRGLNLRKKQGRGGALSAVHRARDIAQRKPLPLSTVQRMRLYFDNNPMDANAEPDSPQGIAFALHGGNAGKAWVESVTKGNT